MEKVSKDVPSYKLFQKNIKDLVLQSKIIKQVLTAFSLLEFSTLQKQEIFDIQYKGYKLSEYEFQSFDEINNCLRDLKQIIKQKIPKEFLKRKYEKMKEINSKHFNPSGIKYANLYIKNFNKLYKDFIESFCMDRFSQLNINRFSKSERETFIIEGTKLVMDIICNKLCMGGLRIIYKIMKEQKKEAQLSGELNKKSECWEGVQYMDQKIKGLKSEGDLVDCELIHLACFGFQNKRCYCYTTDKEEVIIDRLETYCIKVHGFIWMFFDSKNFETKPQYEIDQYRHKYERPELKCGKVFILNRDTGEKASEICVQKIYNKIKASSRFKREVPLLEDPL